MDDTSITRRGLPEYRQLGAVTAVTIRHFPGDDSARAAVQAKGLAWPELPGDLAGSDPYLAWRSPQEVIAFGTSSGTLTALRDLLAPGRSETAMAADLSDALVVFELQGLQLDAWLSHLVDACAIPSQPGRVFRCRLADVPVLLLRIDSERVWLTAERPIAPYLSNWLSYSHQGAFSE